MESPGEKTRRPAAGFQHVRTLAKWGVSGCLAILLTVAAQAQETMSDATLARETSDPTTNLWLMFTEFASQFTPSQPYRGSNQFTLELQPSMPVFLTPGLRVLNFPDAVFASEGTPHQSQATGLQSFSWLGAFSPVANGAPLSWGLGPYISFPVSTDEYLARSQWQFGGGGVLSWRTPDFVSSVEVKSGWTTAGSGPQAGSLQIQYNLQRFFGDGCQVGLGRPRIEYDWNRNGSGSWSVPVGIDVAKIFHFGPMPVKIMLEYDFTVINDNRWNPQHLFRITILPVIRDPLRGPLFE